MSELGTIGNAVKAFVANAETTLEADANLAWDWLKLELAKIEPTILAQVKAAINEVAVDLESGETAGVAMADVLTVLARDGIQDVMAVKTDVLNALIGLTTASPASTATVASAS